MASSTIFGFSATPEPIDNNDFLLMWDSSLAKTFKVSRGNLLKFDNTSTSLSSTNIEEALKEIDSEVHSSTIHVQSVFGRTGIVSATYNDYNSSQISFTSSSCLSSTNVQNAVDESYNKLNNKVFIISAANTINSQNIASLSSSDYTNSQNIASLSAEVGNIIQSSASINVASIDFSTIGNIPSWKEGRIFYDNTNHTLGLYVDNSEVTLQIGQELYIRVINKTSSIIKNGTVVALSGAIGNVPEIIVASANNYMCCNIIGVSTHDINIDESGVVTSLGMVNDLNTSAFNVGDQLYLTNIGTITNIQPNAPTPTVVIGHVVKSHGNLGSILVNCRVSPTIEQLSNVNGNLPVTNSILTYNGNVWTPYNINDVLSASNLSASNINIASLSASISASNINIASLSASISASNVNIASLSAFKQNKFVGIDCTTPITYNDISVDYDNRIVSITPPLGYFNFYLDGNGEIKKFTKNGVVTFPVFDDTSGYWNFYFDETGEPKVSNIEHTNIDYILPVYRIYWNNTKTGINKAISEAFLLYCGELPVFDMLWKKAYGAIWYSGLNIISNPLTSDPPNSTGLNTCVSITSGAILDRSILYYINNTSATEKFGQNLGTPITANITTATGALFTVAKITSGYGENLSATTFPFAWDVSTNRPEYITPSGVRTLVDNGYYYVYFIYAFQDPRSGQSIRIVSGPSNYSNISNARAANWDSIQVIYPGLSNKQVRPLYRLLFEYRNNYSPIVKYSVLREVQDLRIGIVNTTTSIGTVPGTSVTIIPSGNIISTNAENAIHELDSYITLLSGTANTNSQNISSLSGTANTNSQNISSLSASINGGYQSVNLISTNTTLNSSHVVVIVTNGSTIILPNASLNTNKYYNVIRSGTSDVTINTSNSQTISGDLNLVLKSQWDSVAIISDGSNWVRCS